MIYCDIIYVYNTYIHLHISRLNCRFLGRDVFFRVAFFFGESLLQLLPWLPWCIAFSWVLVDQPSALSVSVIRPCQRGTSRVHTCGQMLVSSWWIVKISAGDEFSTFKSWYQWFISVGNISGIKNFVVTCPGWELVDCSIHFWSMKNSMPHLGQCYDAWRCSGPAQTALPLQTTDVWCLSLFSSWGSRCFKSVLRESLALCSLS